MRPYNIEGNSLQEDEIQQFGHFGQSKSLSRTQTSENTSTFQKLTNEVKTCSQKGILIIILFIIVSLVFYKVIARSDQSDNVYGEIMFTQDQIGQMIKNTLSKDSDTAKDGDKQSSIQQLAKTHSITTTQIQNAIRFSQIVPNIGKKEQKSMQKLLDEEYNYLQQKYRIKESLSAQISFCVLFPSIEQNLNGQSIQIAHSILAQNYKNYKIVLTGSYSDSSQKSLSNYLRKRNLYDDKINFIVNAGQNILKNIYFGIRQHCNLGQVVILASQPSSLIGINVLSLLNSFYQGNRASLIYTQYLKVDFKTLTLELGDVKNVSKLIKNPKELKKVEFANQFPFVSFFSDVFYSIPLSSLTIQTQKFYSDTWETALFRSLFEVAGQKTLYLNEITYIVDQQNVNSVNQKSIHYIKEIEQLQKEQQIKKPSISIDSQKPLKENKKQQIDQDLKKNIYEEEAGQSKQNNEKENKQIQIFQRQEPNAQLKEASLENLQFNERDPLVSPAVVKLKEQKQENAQHSQIVEKIVQSEHRPEKTQSSQISKQAKKSTQILPIDQFGFVQDVDDEDVVDIVTPKKDTVNQNIKKINIIAGRMDVKGPNYTFNVSFQQMINNSDVQTIFGKRKSKEGIWRNQFTEAIQKLQITNNVKYGGQIEIQLTKFDYDKFQKQKRVQQLINNQTTYLEQNYKISQYKKKQLPFCIVVPSYNNVDTGLYLRNLNSIFMQNYSNYHVVYIDDASKDKTGEYVKSYIISRNIPMQKIQIITNKQTRKPPYNIYNAITNHCKLGELALVVQGDDALIGTNVLNLYNAIYQRDKCAMIYSGYLDIFDNSRTELGVAHQILDQYFQKNQIRKITQIPGKYLLSFYVDVFKSIKTEEFKDPKGYFFWFSYDRALITPLLQISYPRISIVKQILYEHRRDTDKRQSINDWNRESSQILAKKAYKPLKFFPFIERNKYKYFFDEPIDKVIQNSDFDVFTFANNFESEGISKDMHVRAIKLTQLIHNVKFGGQVVAQLTDFQSSKQQKQQRILKLLEDDKNYYNEKYEIDTYRKDELPFCILTPSYNNVKSGLYLRNLDSIFMQDYNNYHVVYIDDASPDHTGEYVQKYLQAKNIPKHLIEVIINKQNKKALANIHLGIHKYCKSGQIVAIIDGDDSFIGRNVLALFNAIYQRDKAAMAYSNFLTIHNNDRTELGFCHEINKEMFEQNTFRNSWDLPGTHLMTFYSDLFKKIKISDLTYANGTFYDYAYDRAILTPLLQMAYPRISVIKEITYEYRNDTGINDSPDDWIRVSHVILDKKPYSHLIQFPFIKGLIVSTDKFNFKAQIQTVIKNTNFTAYEQEQNKKIKGIAKQQHIHAIRLTELVHNINFKGEVDISLKSNKNADKKKERLEKLLKSDKQYLQTKYEISKYKSKQLPFCIVVSSFSSVQNGLYLRNLDSILMQDYKSYRVVYINDNSPDQAHQYIKKYLQEKQIPAHVLKMILNEQTRHELSNIYYAAHNWCKLNEIMLVVGGNDALIGRNVLNVLNALYQKQKAKVGYSCFLKVYNISTQLGKCEDIDQFYFKTKTFRNKLQFQNYRLMSFYTHFFRRIKIRDLTFENGTFFNNAIDKAIMTPLIQMAYPDILVAKQIMYEDRHDKEADDLTLEGTQINIILSKDPYQKLSDKQFQVI